MAKIIRVFSYVFVLGAMLAVSACGTLNGVGQDVSSVGQGISGSARTVQQHMQ
jgi:predicted small secreted protein